MNAAERVLAACAFQTTDRVPRVEFFWDYPAEWGGRLGPIEAVNDVVILAPNEGPFPSRPLPARNGGYRYEIDACRVGAAGSAFFVETLERFRHPARIESETFEPPSQEARMPIGVETVEFICRRSARPDSSGCGRKRLVSKPACLAKSWPFCALLPARQFLIDIAQVTAGAGRAEKVSDIDKSA
jgi:hypothetical protein